MPMGSGPPSHDRRRSRRARSRVVAILLAGTGAGCATQADLAAHQRTVMSAIQEQSRVIQGIQSEVTDLRSQVERRGGRPTALPPTPPPPLVSTPSGSGPSPDAVKAATLEQRVHELEQRKALPSEIGMTPSPEGVSTDASTTGQAVAAQLPQAVPATAPPAPAAGAAATAVPPQQLAAVAAPSAVPPPGQRTVDAEWKREVAQERAVAATTGGAERTAYLGALDGLGSGNCSDAASQLDAVRNGASGSPLADNAVYWKARCAALQGDEGRAVSELDGLVTHYPKSDKAPAALWQQGQLLIGHGDLQGARAALSKLIRDYPSTVEAERARRRLAELGLAEIGR